MLLWSWVVGYSVSLSICLVACTSPAPHASVSAACPNFSTRTVARDGNNTQACLHPAGPPCATLDYALSQLVDCLQIVINDSSVSLTAPVYIRGVHGVVLRPAETGERVLVSCDSEGAGLYFEDVNNTELYWMMFERCSVVHPSAILVPTYDLFYPNITSALFFTSCVNITLETCSFMSSRGSGISIFNSGGSISVRNSSFVNNTLNVDCTGPRCYNVSVGLNVKMTYCHLNTNCTSPQPVSIYNSNSHYIIENCMFYGNNNSFTINVTESEAVMAYSVHRTVSHGGGVEVRLEGQATGNTFEFTNCTFTRNLALWGGGLEVGIGEDSNFNTVQVTSSTFSQNRGLVGGGVRMGVFPPTGYDGYGHDEKGNHFSISDSVFEGNTAISAGAISFISNAQLTNDDLTHLTVTRSLFISNSANDSGAAVAINAWNNEVGGFPTYAEFIDCTFEENSMDFQVDATEIFGLGVINTEKIPLIFTGNMTFVGNSGSAVVASSTVVVMNGTVDFTDNWSINGAGVALMSLAWVQLNSRARVNFVDNTAYMRGGAIHTSFSTQQVMYSSRYCPIRYSDNSVPVSEWDAVVRFDNNKARLDGPSIFLGMPVTCYQENGTELPFTDPHVFHYSSSDDSHNQVSGPPQKVKFGDPAVYQNETYHTSVMLGTPFHLHPITQDFYDSLTTGSALVSLICDPLYPDQCNTTTLVSDYRLEGGQLIQLDNKNRTTLFSIHGPQNDTSQNKTVLLVLSNTLPSAMGYLHISIDHCKLGYTYNSTSGSCECTESSEIACGFTNNDNRACVKYGYWVGYDSQGKKKKSVIQHCDNNICKYNNGYCPAGDCLRSLQSFCLLPDYDSDQLCEANRGGLLCSSCKKGHAFTYGAVQCVPENTCTNLHSVLLILLNLLFWCALIVTLLIALKLNFQIGSGNMYCLIYYFSVLPYLTQNNYDTFLTSVIYLFSGFLEVNPRFFGLIPVCMFGEDFGPIYHAVLGFIHPFFLFGVIFLLIVVKRRFPRLSRLVEFDGTKALCILLYLSFTSLTQTSLILLDFTTLGHDSDDVRVVLEPTVSYFDPAHHLPWALLSIAILLLVALPFILTLLLTPTLAKTLHIRYIRFKPILDQYQSCYHNKYRWFASYYLICRVVVFIFSLLNLGEFGSIFFLQMISIIILVVHTVVQPYRKPWLNLLDSVLLTDLAIYSLFNGSTANVVLDRFSKNIRTLLLYTLLLTPVIYFIVLCYYSLHTALHLTKLVKKLLAVCKRRKEQLTTSLSAEEDDPNSPPVAVVRNPRRDLERESLLFSRELQSSSSLDSCNKPPRRKGTNTTPSSAKSKKISFRKTSDLKSPDITTTSVSPPH